MAAFNPLPPLPGQSTMSPPGLSGVSGGSAAPGPEGPIEAVRGILQQLLQATQIVQNVARQFPAVAEYAQSAADAIQQMAASVVTGAETGSDTSSPPPGGLT